MITSDLRGWVDKPFTLSRLSYNNKKSFITEQTATAAAPPQPRGNKGASAGVLPPHGPEDEAPGHGERQLGWLKGGRVLPPWQDHAPRCDSLDAPARGSLACTWEASDSVAGSARLSRWSDRGLVCAKSRKRLWLHRSRAQGCGLGASPGARTFLGGWRQGRSWRRGCM